MCGGRSTTFAKLGEMAVHEPTERDQVFKRTFGEVLRQLRTERQLSQEALALAAGCHVNHISFLERGLRSPNLVVVFDLATALGLAPSELVARVEKRLQPPVRATVPTPAE